MIRAIIIILILSVGGLVWSPEYITVYEEIPNVRILAYSSKQPRECSKLPNGKSARNEIGASVPRGFLPYGTIVAVNLKGKMIRRTIDDRTPQRAVRIIGTRKILELRWFGSIKSPEKTKSVNRELCNRFDGGWGTIWVEKRIERVEP